MSCAKTAEPIDAARGVHSGGSMQRSGVRPSVRPSARLSVPSIAAVFRSLSAAGARAQQQLCCSPGAGAARYRSISARARAAAAGSVMLRAEVRRLNTDLFVVTLITGY